MNGSCSLNSCIQKHPYYMGGAGLITASLAAVTAVFFAVLLIRGPHFISTYTSYAVISSSGTLTILSLPFLGYIIYQCKKRTSAMVLSRGLYPEKAIQDSIYKNFSNIKHNIKNIYIYTYAEAGGRHVPFGRPEESTFGEAPKNGKEHILILLEVMEIPYFSKLNYESHGLNVIYGSVEDRDSLQKGKLSPHLHAELKKLDQQLA